MSYLLHAELLEGGSEGRLALYRHSLLKEAHATGKELVLRAVGSGWDDVAKAPTQLTDISPPVAFEVMEVTPSRLRLRIADWPESAPLGELMQFSVGDHGGELYLWTRALAFSREAPAALVEVDAEG